MPSSKPFHLRVKPFALHVLILGLNGTTVGLLRLVNYILFAAALAGILTVIPDIHLSHIVYLSIVIRIVTNDSGERV